MRRRACSSTGMAAAVARCGPVFPLLPTPVPPAAPAAAACVKPSPERQQDTERDPVRQLDGRDAAAPGTSLPGPGNAAPLESPSEPPSALGAAVRRHPGDASAAPGPGSGTRRLLAPRPERRDPPGPRGGICGSNTGKETGFVPLSRPTLKPGGTKALKHSPRPQPARRAAFSEGPRVAFRVPVAWG